MFILNVCSDMVKIHEKTCENSELKPLQKFTYYCTPILLTEYIFTDVVVMWDGVPTTLHIVYDSWSLYPTYIKSAASTQIYQCKHKKVMSYEIMDIHATLWHRAKIYFTCTTSILWLVTVTKMDNIINPFFSKILQQTHKS